MLQIFPAIDNQMAATTAVLQTRFSVDLADARRIFVPYRICPLGAHVDHQGGHVLGRTIPSGTFLAYAPLPEPEIRLASANFSDSICFELGAAVQPEHWGRYAQAAALALQERHKIRRGFVGVSNGAMIGAGLSSSASVGLAYLQALADVNEIYLSKEELVELDLQLERTQLGLQNGILDQSAILYGREDALVYIDTRCRQTRLISDPPQIGQAGWLIAYSGVARELTRGGGFNRRVTECRRAAQWLQRTAVTLSDVPPHQFKKRAAAMPEILRRRATHFFGEVFRVSQGATAWQVGDLSRFGALMNESCASSIHQYESGHEAVIALQEIVSGTAGVYGSRFSGGGYGGCVIALADRMQAETAAARIVRRYRAQFPTLAEKMSIYWVEKEETE